MMVGVASPCLYSIFVVVYIIVVIIVVMGGGECREGGGE